LGVLTPTLGQLPSNVSVVWTVRRIMWRHRLDSVPHDARFKCRNDTRRHWLYLVLSAPAQYVPPNPFTWGWKRNLRKVVLFW